MRTSFRRCLVPAVLVGITVLPACRRQATESPQPASADTGTADPTVNPPLLMKPAPADRNLIATNEWLYGDLHGSPGSLNPIFTSTSYDVRLRDLLWDRPFRFDRELGWMVNPAMVEFYTEAPDHLSAVLKLRPGLTWQDGHPLTAEDIVFSWQQILDPEVPCPSAKTGTDQIAECVALNTLTVKFVHQAALPTNKWNVMFSIIPKHVYEKGKSEDPTLRNSDYHNKVNRHPMGNGPYKLVEWIENDRIVLQRWEDYPGKKPYFKRQVLRLISERNSAMFAFEKQEIDEIRLTPQQFALETNSDRFRRVGVKGYGERWSFYYIGWNQDGSNPYFVDRDVRIAMAHAFDYDRILKTVFHGLYPRSYGIFHPDSPMYAPDIKLYDFDSGRAAELLDGAGWRIDSEDGWRYKDVAVESGGAVRRKFSFTFHLPRGSTTAPMIAAIFQEDLAKLGVEMKTRVIEFTTFRELNFQHEFEAQASVWGTGVDPDSGWNLWRTEAYHDGRNYGGYSNERVDELFELGRHEFDEAKRMKHYAMASKLIYEDAPYLFVCYSPTLWGFHKRLRGVQFSPRGPFNFWPAELAWWVPAGEALHDGIAP